METATDLLVSQCQSFKIFPSLQDTLRSKGLDISLDPNTQAWLDQLKLIWKTWKRSTAMENSIEELFRSRPDVFRVALVFVIKCEEYKDSKPKSLPFFLIEILLKYSQTYKVYADESLKMPAFLIATNQRNNSFQSLLLKTYQVSSIKDSIVPVVNDMIKNENNKQASQIVVALELFDDIPVEDLLFPLVLHDKPNMIDDYLSEAPRHVTPFLLFLDKLLDKKFKMLNFVQEYAEKNHISHVKMDKLNYKSLGKLVARLCNKFHIPLETCKNLSNNRTASGLRYLVYRKYVEHNITNSVWEDLVKDTLRQSSESIPSFLDVLIDHDKAEALKWAKYLNIPEHDLPSPLRGAVEELPKEDEENWDTANVENNQKFYKSPLTRDKITIIESGEQFYDLISKLQHLDVVSLDCEWKPSFGAKLSQVAVIQLGTRDMVYLIDIVQLNKPEYASFWVSFYKSFLENAEVIKLGFGLEQDLREMKASIIGLSNIKVNGAGFLDLSILWRVLVENELSLPPCSDKGSSLSALVQTCFGRPLEKSEQCSNWELRPLRETQIMYAAIDADILIRLYNYLQNRCQEQGINFEAICNCIMDEVTKKIVRNKTKTMTTTLITPVETKYPSNVKFLIDLPSNNIMPCLRFCGIDTICTPPLLWHDIVNLAISEDRMIIVSKPKHTPTINFPQSSIICIRKGHTFELLHGILTLNKIHVQESDLLSVCLYCNSKDLRKLNTDQVQELCKLYEAASRERLNQRYVVEDDEEDIDFGNFLSESEGEEEQTHFQHQNVVTESSSLSKSCKTGKDVQIVIDDAPKLSLSKKPAILCEDCGKVYSNNDSVYKSVCDTVLKVTKLAHPTWMG